MHLDSRRNAQGRPKPPSREILLWRWRPPEDYSWEGAADTVRASVTAKLSALGWPLAPDKLSRAQMQAVMDLALVWGYAAAVRRQSAALGESMSSDLDAYTAAVARGEPLSMALPLDLILSLKRITQET